MGRTSRTNTRMLALVAVLGLAVASLPPSSVAAKPKKQWRWVAPGVHWRLYRMDTPNKIRVVRIDPAARVTVDTVLATNKLPGRERVASMARRTRAIVAINGDYSRPSGRPVFTFARDGHLDQWPAIIPSTGLKNYGRNFALDVHERNVFIGHPRSRAWVWVPDAEGGVSHEIHRVNDRSLQRAAAEQMRAFTSAGGKEERPPRRGCYARLHPIRGPRATDRTHAPRPRDAWVSPVGVEQRYVVAQRRCRYRRILPRGGITLYTPQRGRHADVLRGMEVGTETMFGWSLGWPDVFDTVGGNPTLIEEGVVQRKSIHDGSSFVSGRHPRTAVAYNRRADKLFFVTVDGRRPRYSKGMTLAQLTRFLRRRLGATDALNLDGGGSTTMVVGGKIKGRPSDGTPRAVSSALVVLPGRDPGEPRRRQASFADSALTSAPWIPGAPEAPADASPFEAMAEDPASVGGLAAWLQQEGHDLPRFLERTADDFRARGPIID
ncbi:MAG: phosphodiester glycosidase family protein [Actinomycetota bacterium]